jgi:X-X-X-Leu-X-X-Gly heptad repeat protein
MNINAAQVAAFGRHILSFALGGVAAAAALHVVAPTDAATITGAINQIASGVSSLVAGVSTLASVGLGLYAAWTASSKSQISAVAANPAVTSVVVATPALANSIPSNKVISQ